jgi:hypothetical protein
LWNSSASLALHRSFHEPTRYALVRYEDFVSRPLDTLERVCAVVGVRPEPERMLAMADYEEKENSSFSEASSSGAYADLIRRNDEVDRRGVIPRDEIDLIVRLCSDRAYLLGYTLDDRAPSMRAPLRIAIRFGARRAVAKAQRLVLARRRQA